MIGIFDSGIGGLTVAKAIREVLPEYQVIYLGDTARLPYGNRSADLIYQFACEGLDYLFAHGCQIVIAACNTVSAQALRRLQQEYLPQHYPDRRVLGVIRPLVEAAARQTRNGRIGVIGTHGTIASGAYQRELSAQNPRLAVVQNACPLLVPLIEEGWAKKPETRKILKAYLRPLKHARVDTLILGCTHYQIVSKDIQGIMGPRCRALPSNTIVAESFKDYLGRHPEIEKKIVRGQAHGFCATDLTEEFSNNASRYLGKNTSRKRGPQAVELIKYLL